MLGLLWWLLKARHMMQYKTRIELPCKTVLIPINAVPNFYNDNSNIDFNLQTRNVIHLPALPKLIRKAM